MEVAFEDGELELVLLDEANERELEASEATLVGVPSTLEPVPNNPAYGFLGLPGDAIYVLPQDEREGVLYLGIAGDEIPAGAFNNDAVDLGTWLPSTAQGMCSSTQRMPLAVRPSITTLLMGLDQMMCSQ